MTERARATRRHLHTLLGLYLVVVLLVAAAGVVLAAVAIAVGLGTGHAFDFTGEWTSLEGAPELTLEVSDAEDVIVASLTAADEDWHRDVRLMRVDASQLAGRLGAPQGVTPQADRPAVITAPEGSSLSIARLAEDEVIVSLRSAGEQSWTDVATLRRGGPFWARYGVIQTVVLMLLLILAVSSVGLGLAVPVVSRLDGRPAPGGDELVLRVAGVIAAVVLFLALLGSQSILAIGAYVVMLGIWCLHVFKWLPQELPRASDLLAYLFSRRRRAELDAELARQEEQAVRGAALEGVLYDVQGERAGGRSPRRG